MSDRILVTGATGTVGGAVARALAAGAGDSPLDLVCAARSEAGATALRARQLCPVHLDYDDPASLHAALDGVDRLLLVTGYTVDMLVHSKRLLDAAKARGVRHIVHLGALADDASPHAHFAWHRLVELAIERMGFAWTHLRPNFFIDTVWQGYRRTPDRLVHFVADARVSWVSSDDMAAVAAEILRHPARHAGRTYPLAVEALTLAEIAALLSDLTGRAVAYRPRPAADLLAILLKQGMEPHYAAGLAEGVAAIARGDMPLAGATYDTVREVTGRPAITWKTFIEARRQQLPPP